MSPCEAGDETADAVGLWVPATLLVDDSDVKDAVADAEPVEFPVAIPVVDVEQTFVFNSGFHIKVQVGATVSTFVTEGCVTEVKLVESVPAVVVVVEGADVDPVWGTGSPACVEEVACSRPEPDAVDWAVGSCLCSSFMLQQLHTAI